MCVVGFFYGSYYFLNFHLWFLLFQALPRGFGYISMVKISDLHILSHFFLSLYIHSFLSVVSACFLYDIHHYIYICHILFMLSFTLVICHKMISTIMHVILFTWSTSVDLITTCMLSYVISIFSFLWQLHYKILFNSKFLYTIAFIFACGRFYKLTGLLWYTFISLSNNFFIKYCSSLKFHIAFLSITPLAHLLCHILVFSFFLDCYICFLYPSYLCSYIYTSLSISFRRSYIYLDIGESLFDNGQLPSPLSVR